MSSVITCNKYPQALWHDSPHAVSASKVENSLSAPMATFFDWQVAFIKRNWGLHEFQ